MPDPATNTPIIEGTKKVTGATRGALSAPEEV